MGEHGQERPLYGFVRDGYGTYPYGNNGSKGLGTSRVESRIPGDDRIRNTLDDAGYDPALLREISATPDSPLWGLIEHPAVRKHGRGMSSADLASFTEALASFAQSRVRGTGAEQYEEATGQQFERMTPEAIAEYALEEFADVINYMSMSAIKMLAAVRAMRDVSGG